MRVLKSFIIVLAAGFLFLGSMGINVFSHVCEEDGTHVSYFISDDSVCGGHEHESNDQEQSSCGTDNACCCDEVPEENEDKGCCSISTDLLKVDLDFCNTVVLKAVIANASCTAPVWGVVPMPKLEEGDEIIHSDPPLEPRGLLVAHQQWLI